MKLVLTAILISLLVSGCSTNTESAETRIDISKLKRQACDGWLVGSQKIPGLVSFSVAILFQQIAEQDDRYTELSRAAFYLAIIGKSQNLLDELKPKWFESAAEVYRHCTSDEFLSFDPEATTSP